MRRTCGFDLSYPRAVLGFSRCRYSEAGHARLLCACIELTRSSDLDHNRAARVFDVMQVLGSLFPQLRQSRCHALAQTLLNLARGP